MVVIDPQEELLRCVEMLQARRGFEGTFLAEFKWFAGFVMGDILWVPPQQVWSVSFYDSNPMTFPAGTLCDRLMGELRSRGL